MGRGMRLSLRRSCQTAFEIAMRFVSGPSRLTALRPMVNLGICAELMPSIVSAASLPGAAVCTLMRIHRLVAMDVAAIAMNPALPPTRFVVVGDHAPPFFSRDKRAIFSPDSVAFVELVPRGLERRTPTAAHVTSAAGTGGR